MRAHPCRKCGELNTDNRGYQLCGVCSGVFWSDVGAGHLLPRCPPLVPREREGTVSDDDMVTMEGGGKVSRSDLFIAASYARGIDTEESRAIAARIEAAIPPKAPAVLRYFIDTEFMEDGQSIDLISIGVVCEDGREFYAESTQARWSDANEWVQENVLPHLWARSADKVMGNRWSRDGGTGGYLSRPHIARDLVRWVAQGDGTPEFWAYYADYDWVAVCQLFGTMMDLPDGWPMFCMDLKQEAVRLGDPKLPEQASTEHHALDDARWNREAFAFLAALRDAGEPS